MLADDDGPISGAAWADPEKTRLSRNQPTDFHAGGCQALGPPSRVVPGIRQPNDQRLISQVISLDYRDQRQWFVVIISVTGRKQAQEPIDRRVAAFLILHSMSDILPSANRSHTRFALMSGSHPKWTLDGFRNP